jgi:hypothetical protein
MEDPELFRLVQIMDAFKQELLVQRDALLAGTEPVTLAATGNSSTAKRTDAERADGMEAANEDGAGLADSDKSGNLPILPFGLWMKQPFSLAASLLLAVLGFNAWQTPAPDSATTSAFGVNTLVVLETTRGGGDAAGFGQSPYLLQIDAGFDAGVRPYGVTLSDSTGSSLLSLQDLRADSDGWVRLLVDEPLAGEYQLVLTWAEDNGQITDKAFNFQISP